VIRSDRVDVYCNPVNYVYLLPLIAHWRRVRIHCLPETVVNIVDDYELSSSASVAISPRACYDVCVRR